MALKNSFYGHFDALLFAFLAKCPFKKVKTGSVQGLHWLKYNFITIKN